MASRPVRSNVPPEAAVRQASTSDYQCHLNPPSFWGHSQPDRAAFRKFLKHGYGDVSALRQAWNDPQTDFASAEPPSKEQRLHADLGFFRDPAKSQRVCDFNRYYNEIVAETIECFARIVKEESAGQSLCGVFYGYLFELTGSPESGHLALQRLLHCPDLDFFCAPSSYRFRSLVSGTTALMSATEAIRFHGKLWFDENDCRTLLSAPKQKAYLVHSKSIADDVLIQKREVAYVIAEGCGMWWFDMQGGWYDSPELMSTVARLDAVAQRVIHCDRSSAAEVAVVIDEESMDYREGRGALARLLLDAQRLQLHRMGAPFDAVLLDDLEKLRPYKLYIFLNTFRVTPEQRAAIARVVKRAGRTALWVYAPGFVGRPLGCPWSSKNDFRNKNRTERVAGTTRMQGA
jgi:beta-galactosidase